MDAAEARVAIAAWQRQPKGLRKGALELGSYGYPTPDRDAARLLVDRGLAQPYDYGWQSLRLGGLFLLLGFAREFVGPGFWALLFALQCFLLWRSSSDGSTQERLMVAAKVNLVALVAADVFPAHDTLEIRATRRPTAGFLMALGFSAVFLGVIVFTAVREKVDLQTSAFVAAGIVLVATFFLVISRFRRHRRHIGRRPQAGATVLSLRPDGLRLHQIDLTVPWSAVATVEITPAGKASYLPLAVSFTFGEPQRTVAYELQWLDQHPGTILATARHLMRNVEHRTSLIMSKALSSSSGATSFNGGP